MAIKTIRVKNFKSFKDVEVHLGNFNVLIGANASGKSNFIRVIEFLRDAQRHGLENAISLQGGPEYLTNLNIGPDENLFVEVVVSEDGDGGGPVIGTSRTRDRRLVMKPQEARYSFSVGFARKRAAFEILDERLAVKGEFLVAERSGARWPRRTGGLGEITLVREGDRLSVKKFMPPEGESLEEYEVEPWLTQENVSERSLNLQLQHHPLAVGSLAENVAIYDFDPKLSKKATPIIGKAELEEDGSNLAVVLKRIMEDESAKRKLVNFLQDLLPFVSGLAVEKFENKSLLFSLRETYAKNKDLPSLLISDGTINITALIVALYFERKSIAVIEEPERNLHPYLISRVTAMMKEASRQKQIIVTSHNPEVVRNVDIADVLLVSRDAEGFSTISRPSEREDVKVFLHNQIGLEELFAQNLLHA
jgi:predicted ATPase